MTCVQMYKTNVIERVPDDVAHDLVRSGAAIYTNKERWKARKSNSEPEADQ